MKTSIAAVPLIYPLPMAIVGVENNTGTFFATIQNLTIISREPAVFAMVIGSKRHMHRHLEIGTRFSLNMPTTTMIDKADLCASISSDTFDKAKLFDTAHVKGVPVIEACPVVLLAEVTDMTTMHDHTFYICAVKDTLLEERLPIDGHIPSLNVLDPILYGLDDKYYTVGRVIGKASKEGQSLYQSVRKTMAPQPYSFHFKYKICKLKNQGVSYKDLSDTFNVYHETIEDWYTLYTLFGRNGLTKKMANRLAASRFTKAEKAEMVRQIMQGEKTYRDVCGENMVSLSRLKNWVKKARKEKKRAT
ncbi:MAG: hypothetical protein EA374_05745 [Acholeplasmatales bacterium]|nr:MAG: hypothetical protein EA374_05745 [Acholeplasmatales bacterium]